MVTMGGWKNRFLALAFAVLATQQVLRFIFSLKRQGKDDIAEKARDSDQPGFQSKFLLSQFSGYTSEQEQQHRKEHLYSSCPMAHVPKTMNDLSTKQRTMLLKHIIVSDKYQFLYCYVPKVACSNWKRVVMLLHGLTDSAKAKAAAEHPHGMKYLSEYSDHEIKHKLKHYYKFTFVRNPLERLLSAYRNKFGEIEDTMRNYGVKIIKKYRNTTAPEEYEGKIPGDDVTFEEFIRFLVDGGPTETMNEHWAPMLDLCQPCVVKYDYVGSYDNLYEDSEAILKRVEAPDDIHLPERQAFYSPTTNTATAYFYSLVGREYLAAFLKKYCKDFTLFSFRFPEFLYPSKSKKH